MNHHLETMMNCLLCSLPTGQPKDSYGFTMPELGTQRCLAKHRQVRVHKTCLRNCGKNCRERFTHVVNVYADSRIAQEAERFARSFAPAMA